MSVSHARQNPFPAQSSDEPLPGLRQSALATPARRFEVHEASEDRARGHAVEALSFEEAAMEFLEAWHPAADDHGDVTLVVTDCETGREHCLRVELETGETAPCD
jgi:hypothetical protein